MFFTHVNETLSQIEKNTSRKHSKLVGQTFEIWTNLVNMIDKIPRIVRVESVDHLTGMIYIRKVADAPKIGDKITIEPAEFEGWVHPMNILALTPYTEGSK